MSSSPWWAPLHAAYPTRTENMQMCNILLLKVGWRELKPGCCVKYRILYEVHDYCKIIYQSGRRRHHASASPTTMEHTFNQCCMQASRNVCRTIGMLVRRTLSSVCINRSQTRHILKSVPRLVTGTVLIRRLKTSRAANHWWWWLLSEDLNREGETCVSK